MTKEEIIGILGKSESVTENKNKTALIVAINSGDINVVVTVPYEVHELFYEALDNEGNILLKDGMECYGDMEFEDYKECLLDIVDVMKAPKFRLTNNRKTLEAYGYQWYYFFGEFKSS